MADKKLYPIVVVQSIEVKKSLGIDRPGIKLDGLTNGVNIIHGPNAAGKTTLARTFNALFWPETVPPGSILSGQFKIGGEGWAVSLEHHNAVYQREGKRVPAPGFAPVEFKDRYNLALHQLLQTETKNKDFASLIVRELAGGYDISEAVEKLQFKERVSGFGNKTQALKQAVASYGEAKNSVLTVEEDARKLEKLKRQRREAVNARNQQEILKQLLQWKKARQKVEKNQGKLKKYPDVMDKLVGNEQEQLDKLDEKITRQNEQLEKTSIEISQLEEKIDKVIYPFDEIRLDYLPVQQSRVEQLEKLEERLDKFGLEEASYLKQIDSYEKKLGVLSSFDKLGRIDSSVLIKTAKLASEYEKLQAELSSLEKLKELFASTGKTLNNEFQRGCQALQNWLSNPPQKSSKISIITHLNLLLVAGLTILLSSFWHPGLLLGLFYPVVYYLYCFLGKFRSSADPRIIFQAEYEALELPFSPAEWTDCEVRNLLRRIYDEIARQTVQIKFNETWKNYQARYQNLLEQQQIFQQQHQLLIEKYGFPAEIDSRNLHWQLEKLTKWQEARAKLEGIREMIKISAQKRAEIINELNSQFELWRLDKAVDFSTARGNIQVMEITTEKFDRLTGQLHQAWKDRRRTIAHLAETVRERHSIFERFELTPDKQSELVELIEQYSEYKNQREELNQARGTLRAEEQRLEELEGLDSQLKEQSVERLEKQLEQYSKAAEQFDEINERVIKIENAIEGVKSGYEIEPSLAQLERARSSLVSQLDEDWDKLVGHQLAGYIERINSVQQMPPVFQTARLILLKISGQRYKLVLHEATDEFEVVDRKTEKLLTLDQLSSGTRIQLLLAVRLAFVQHGESHFKLPLYMDETLANADDLRARWIISSIFNLVEDGRQLFYFTARGDEVAKWRAIADEKKQPLNIIDLTRSSSAEFTGRVEIPGKVDFDIVKPSLPPVEGSTHAEYGKQLKLPPLDLFGEPSGIHLWYLVEDTGVLVKLLEQGIDSVGQLENLLELTGNKLFGKDNRDLTGELMELVKALKLYIKYVRQGKNQPIDRIVLQNSGAVSERFIDQLSDLAERVEWNPARLLEQLETGKIKGFLSRKINDLESFLLKQGYIDRRKPLSREIIRAAIMAELDETKIPDLEDKIERMIKRLTTR